MKINPTILFLIGLVIGVGGTLLGFQVADEKKEREDSIMLIDGIRNVRYLNERVSIELVQRVDDNTIEIAKVLEIPSNDFFRGFHAMEQLVKKLDADGIISRNAEGAGMPAETGDSEPETPEIPEDE